LRQRAPEKTGRHDIVIEPPSQNWILKSLAGVQLLRNALMSCDKVAILALIANTIDEACKTCLDAGKGEHITQTGRTSCTAGVLKEARWLIGR
jgi:hypothetical protein